MIGVIILGFGIALSVIADVILNSGEAFVKAISDTADKNFGNVKIAFDITCVVLAILLSLIFFDYKIVGTREGTIISALCTGMVVKAFTQRLSTPLNQMLPTVRSIQSPEPLPLKRCRHMQNRVQVGFLRLLPVL